MKIDTFRYEADLIAVTLLESDSQRRSQVIDGITQEMFKSNNTARCWSAISSLHNEGEIIDPFMVGGRMGEEGDTSYVLELITGSIATKSQLIGLAKRVRQSSYLQDARNRLLESVLLIDELTDVTQAKTVASSIQEVFDSLLLETDDRKPQLFKDVAKDYLQKLQDKVDGKADEHIILSGISDLDNHTGGFNKTDLVVIAGLSGSGKTEAVIEVMRGVTSNGSGALMFSLEMSNAQVVERAISGESMLPVSHLRTPSNLNNNNGWDKLNVGLGAVINRKIYLEDQTGLTIQDIVTRSKRHKRDHPDCAAIVVDHIGLMSLGKIQTRHDLAVGEITKELKSLAKDIETPVIILSQLTGKQIMLRPIMDREPRAQDIKDSSRIEEDADLIIITHRQLTHDDKAPNIAEWILAKARHAIKGTKVYFRFIDGHFVATSQEHACNEMELYQSSQAPKEYKKSSKLS